MAVYFYSVAVWPWCCCCQYHRPTSSTSILCQSATLSERCRNSRSSSSELYTHSYQTSLYKYTFSIFNCVTFFVFSAFFYFANVSSKYYARSNPNAKTSALQAPPPAPLSWWTRLGHDATNMRDVILRTTIRYDTIRDAILTCARKPT